MLPLLRKKKINVAFCLGTEYGIWCLIQNHMQENVKLDPVSLLPPTSGKEPYMLHHVTFIFYLTEKSMKSLQIETNI